MSIQFRLCTTEDATELCSFSRNQYYETFKGMCSPENMEAYLTKAFDIETIRSELLNPQSSFYFLHLNDKLTGYIKLNEALAQTDIHDMDSLELERIYVAKEAQGAGLGAYLLARTVEIAKKSGKKYIWLGVWEKNTNAILFYQHHGFFKVGTHTFVMGDDVQTDYILRKDL